MHFPYCAVYHRQLSLLRRVTRHQIAAMSNSKAFGDVPRFLLPRTTWTKATFSSLAVPLQATTTQTPPFKRVRRASENRSSQSPGSAHTTSRKRSNSNPPTPSALPRSSRPSSNSVTSAIRHNGVYATAFKHAKRAFHATPSRSKDHHFDTLKFVTRLKDEGFSEEQAVAMMRVLNDVIEESIQNLTRTMVLKEGIGTILK